MIKIYDEFSSQKEAKFDYLQSSLIESELRDLVLRELNQVTLKVGEQSFEEIDGIKVFNAGTDFKVIMTAVGAYQGNLNADNYSEYWNSPYIRSHGNCCSMIANNNLSTAEIKNICLGFSTFEPGMLLREGNTDLNSTIYSRDLDFSIRGGKYLLPDDLINSTRGGYNELVFERRDLAKNRSKFKKNPDYLVFIEEFEGENIMTLTNEDVENEQDNNRRMILLEQKRLWEETKKASMDFATKDENGNVVPLPIVKINREECAKNEIKKIKEAFYTYMETKDPSLLSKIVTQFENNRTGNRSPHDYIREKYFSQSAIEEMLGKITENIKGMDSSELKKRNINMMGRLISMEKRNYTECKQLGNQKPGFNYDKYLQIYSEMRRIEKQNGDR